MTGALIEPHYLPSLEYFCAILSFDRVILEQHEHYVKQSFRNRCYINTSHGTRMLVVPLAAGQGKVPFKEIRMEGGLRWRNNQWRTIQSAYAKSPFFEHYEDELRIALFREADLLMDLDRYLLSFCLRSLGLDIKLSETDTYEKVVDPQIQDLRSHITTKRPFSSRSFYQPRPYQQVFGNAFASNLSLIDLLFCEGPQALNMLRASKGQN